MTVRVLNPETIELGPNWLLKLLGERVEGEKESPMSRIAKLEERFVVGESPPTAAEQDELKDLRDRHPDIAADVDRLDHMSRYRLRREQEIQWMARAVSYKRQS